MTCSASPLLLHLPFPLLALSLAAAGCSSEDEPGGAVAGTGGVLASGGTGGGGAGTGGTGTGGSGNGTGGVSGGVDFQLHTLYDGPLGVAVSAANEEFSLFNSAAATQRQGIVTTHFNQMTAGNIMKMSYLHPSEDTFDFADADQLVTFAKDNGMTVHGHALVWHSDYQVPSFMNDYAGDFSAMLTTHVQTIMEHFDETVISWDVVNEAVTDNFSQDTNGWRRSVFYDAYHGGEPPTPPADGEIPEYIEVAFQAARDADADVDLYYNDYDNTANTERRDKTLQIAEVLNEQGLIDGVGFQMHIYMDYPSLAQFQTAFEAVVELGLKVKLTEIDVPVINPYSESPQPTDFGEAEAQAQRVRYCQVVTTYLETVPEAQQGGVSIWGITDDDSWLMEHYQQSGQGTYEDVWPLLFNADFTAKPALDGVADAFRGNPCN